MDDAAPEAGERLPDTTSLDELVRVFDHDPELLAGTDVATERFLREHGTVRCVRLAPGGWHPPTHRASARHWLGILVVEGFVLRPISITGRRVNELLGPGDLLRPWDHGPGDGIVRTTAPWPVLSPVTLALLDQRFAAVVGRTPSVVTTLVSRALRRSAQVAAGVAIRDAGGTRQRLRLFLQHLAARWGVPEAAGHALPSELSDTAIALAVDADLGAVRDALRALAADGTAWRDEQGRLMLAG